MEALVSEREQCWPRSKQKLAGLKQISRFAIAIRRSGYRCKAILPNQRASRVRRFASGPMTSTF